MKVDMDWFETFSVELSYLDDSNQTVVKHSTSEYNSGIGFGGLELFIVVTVGVFLQLFGLGHAMNRDSDMID